MLFPRGLCFSCPLKEPVHCMLLGGLHPGLGELLVSPVLVPKLPQKFLLYLNPCLKVCYYENSCEDS